VELWAGRRHRVTNPAFEPIIKRLTVPSIPQQRASALVASRAVQTGARVLTRVGAAVVDDVEFATVSSYSRRTFTAERSRRGNAGCTVLTGGAVAQCVLELTTLPRVTLHKTNARERKNSGGSRIKEGVTLGTRRELRGSGLTEKLYAFVN